MGPKFLIAFIGEGEEEVVKFVKRLKLDLESEEVKVHKNNQNEKDEYITNRFMIGLTYKTFNDAVKYDVLLHPAVMWGDYV